MIISIPQCPVTEAERTGTDFFDEAVAVSLTVGRAWPSMAGSTCQWIFCLKLSTVQCILQLRRARSDESQEESFGSYLIHAAAHDRRQLSKY